MRASVFGIVLNLVLVVAKATVGIVSGSVSVLTDAVNNLTDTLSATVTLVVAKLAKKRPDREHPHGHGRIEYVAATVVGVIILAVGISALTTSAPLILTPKLANYSAWSIVVIFTTVVAKGVFSRYLKRVGEETNSRSLAATGTDAMFDALLSLGTLVGAGVSLVFGVSIDGFVGVVIAAFIIRSAVEIIKEGASDVIGRRVDEKLARSVRAKIMEQPEVKAVKKLTLHDYGPDKFLGAAKIEVAPEMTVGQFREVAERIEGEVKSEFNVELAIGVA